MSKQKRARSRPPHERLSDEERSIKRVRNVHNRSQRNARWQCQKLGLGATHAKGQYGMSELLSAARTPGSKNTPRERVRAALPRERYRRRAECSSQSCEQTPTRELGRGMNWVCSEGRSEQLVHAHDRIALLWSCAEQRVRRPVRRFTDHNVATSEGAGARFAKHDDNCVDALAVRMELQLATSVVEQRLDAPDAELPWVREPPRSHRGLAGRANDVL